MVIRGSRKLLIKQLDTSLIQENFVRARGRDAHQIGPRVMVFDADRVFAHGICTALDRRCATSYIDSRVNCDQVGVGDSPCSLGSARPCSQELGFEAPRLDACEAVKMLDDKRHMRQMVFRLAMLHAAAMVACAPHRPAPLSTCADDLRIYALADTLRGVRPARMKRLRSPVTATIVNMRILVTPRGTTLPDSTKIMALVPTDSERSTRAAVEQAEYEPATFNGCAVSFWFEFGLIAQGVN